MQSPEKIVCPVCGRPNRGQAQCTFCGANLGEVGSQGDRTLEPEATAVSKEPHTQRSQEMGFPPSTPGPAQPWEGPSLAPKFAGFWIRTVAYVIDSLLILILLGVLVGVGLFGYVSGSETAALSDFPYTVHEMSWNSLNAVAFVLTVAYFTYFLGRRGQTPGKMLCRLKVIRLDGSPVSYGQAAVRTLGYYINHFTLCLGFLWVAVDRRKQGLHDKIAGTYEIRIGLAEIRDWHPPPPS